MNPRMNPGSFQSAQPHLVDPRVSAEGVAAAMKNIYWWMCVGLSITAIVSLYTFRSETLSNLIYEHRWVLWGSFIVEIGLVVGLVARIQRLSQSTAMAMFIAYAALNGFTLSFIFALYTAGSIASTFAVTAGTFGAMAIYGTVTKRDLTAMGSFLHMGLIGLVIASVVNFFLASPMLYWGVTYLGILIFVGLTAYDVQKLRRMAAAGTLDREKLGILGALILYLDFINLFLLLLRVMGNRR